MAVSVTVKPDSSGRTRPMSQSFASPSAVMRTFPGFTSRWTMPWAWKLASAAAIWAPIRMTSSASRRPFSATSSLSERPRTSSMLMKCTSPSLCRSKRVTVCGCEPRAAWISRRRRSTPRLPTRCGCSTLTATFWPIFVSRASKTTPEPPLPRTRRKRNRPPSRSPTAGRPPAPDRPLRSPPGAPQVSVPSSIAAVPQCRGPLRPLVVLPPPARPARRHAGEDPVPRRALTRRTP